MFFLPPTVFAGTFNLGAWGGAAALGPIVESVSCTAVFTIGAVLATAALLVLPTSASFRLRGPGEA